jgi:tetratricopeptide (TPR) repeat protein
MAAAKKKAPKAKSAKATSVRAKSSKAASKPMKKAAKAGVAKAAKKVAKAASPKGAKAKAGAKPDAKSGKALAAKATKIDPATLFALGVDLSQRGFLFDAIAAFRDASKSAPKNELADDALVNIGLCSLKMGMYADAIDAFSRVIDEYPDATIAEIDEGEEHGRTAAKALYGRVRAKAAIGDFAGAKADVEALTPFDDAYAVESSGDRVTFHSLANQFLASLEG